ncbi:ABC transporter ATP-binding protein [Brooklawnia cerclae]|uniref:Simple sugar transport system ATP-binding protein n=1 Tax=Brooklawnia cerclae TaxID=349934 RepID=A0ABX0SAF1_9ACTN|nr:simple sugar transport system ATP-binding protein [Brooklawnia cerclae]
MLLELKGITKRFGSLVANDRIDLRVEPGRIHALLGENGAGKSTLMNVLYGLYQPDEGEIVIDGTAMRFSGPGDAVAAGIGMVHQHFMLVPVFTVAESVALGYEPTGFAGIINRGVARRKVVDLSERFGFDIDPDALIQDLSVGAQQRVEIIKALSRDARTLILDEPTAVLTPQETDELMAIMRQLADSGTSIVFITHKLREVRAVADAITVIRRGRVVGQASPSSTETELASLMVGRAVNLDIEKTSPVDPPEVCRLDDVTVLDETGRAVVDHVSFTVGAGEVLAVGGVQGNGQTELAEVILGDRTPTVGTITIGGLDATHRSIKQRLDAGMGYVPEDRQADGLIATFSIAENLVLDVHDRPPFAKGAALQLGEIHNHAEKLRDEFDVRVGDIDDPISTLSGGNAQKAILARELSRDLELLVASQPTRGVDVGSIEFIYQRMLAERESGTAIVLFSSELDEIDALADRIVIMYRGQVVGTVPRGTPRDVLGLMMAGVPYEEAAKAGQADDEPPEPPLPPGDDVSGNDEADGSAAQNSQGGAL